MKAVSGVMFAIGLASFAVLALAARKLMSLERALDFGDGVVLSVFAIFGTFCAGLGWLFWVREGASFAPSPAVRTPSLRRVKLSHGCAAAGVLLLILSVLLPAHWFPVAFFFVGLALLAVSHGLTPCVERLEQLRKARSSERQL